MGEFQTEEISAMTDLKFGDDLYACIVEVLGDEESCRRIWR